MVSTSSLRSRQQGFSIVKLLVLVGIAVAILMLAVQVSPSVMEYMDAKKTIERIRGSEPTPQAMRAAFDQQVKVGNITSITGDDLEITQHEGRTDISFAYAKIIKLAGPVSLRIDYNASTDKRSRAAALAK